MQQFDMTTLPAGDRYKLMTGLVVPRPIAFVTSVSAAGTVNAAPFSYFNMFGHDPPIVAIGPGNHRSGEPKDTPRNVLERRELVINLVDEPLAAAMNLCAVAFPYGVGELEQVGLTAVPSLRVAPPRIAESPAHLECQLEHVFESGQTRVLLCRVVMVHIREDLVDGERHYVNAEKMGLIGRMHGRGWYTRTSDRFAIERLTYAQWLARQGPGQGDAP